MTVLVVVVVVDNVSTGVATAAFVAYLSRLTSVGFSASQYAMLSSVMTFLPRFLGGYSGALVNKVGWVSYFFASAGLGIPVLLLLYFAEKNLNKSTNANF